MEKQTPEFEKQTLSDDFLKNLQNAKNMDFVRTLDFNSLDSSQNEALDKKLDGEDIDVEKYKVPTVAVDGQTTNVLTLKEAQAIQSQELRDLFCTNMLNTQLNDYRLKYGFEMAGPQKRTLRRKIYRDYDKGKYKRFLNSNLNG